MADLADLARALDAAPEPATFWWRDDDAGRPDPRLDRLLELAARRGAPLALAVVPAWLTGGATEGIRACAHATVLQHGWAHEDHAAPRGRKIELGGSADPARLGLLLAEGRALLAEAFGERALPVMVPPWNRIAPAFEAALPGLGFSGLSAWGGPARRDALVRVDTHVDVIDWRGTRGFVGLAAVVERTIAALARFPTGPLGILTHHLVMDQAAFAHLDQILALVQDHPRARLRSAGDLFGEAR